MHHTTALPSPGRIGRAACSRSDSGWAACSMRQRGRTLRSRTRLGRADIPAQDGRIFCHRRHQRHGLEDAKALAGAGRRW